MQSTVRSGPPLAVDPPISDSILLSQWQAGDRQAGNQLILRNYSAISMFFRNKAFDESEDLTQKTFDQLCRKKDTFRGESSVRTWLFKVAVNVLIDHIRRLRRREHVDLNLDSLRDLGATPSSVVAKSRQSTQLARALREIPVHEQIVLEMNYWQGCSHAEIAAVLAMPVGTIKSRILQGKARLRERINQRRAGEVVDDVCIEQWLVGLRAEFPTA